MGFFRRDSRPVAQESHGGGKSFAVDVDPKTFFGHDFDNSTPGPVSRIDRATAIQVPAVKRSRDLIAGVLGTLPIQKFDSNNELVPDALLEQPEPDVTTTVTMTKTFEDLVFEGIAWWRVLEFGWHGYPVKVRRLDPRSVNVRRDLKVYITRAGHLGTVTEFVPDAELIRFDSPNDPLLSAGARAIRTALRLDAAADRYADGTPPLDYFTPAEGIDPADDDDVAELLEAWTNARRTRSTAYVPAALKYNAGGFDPAAIQLAEARQHAVLEIARVAGIDPEDLGVSTTSRTYFNAFDRKQARIQDTLRGYISAVEGRLSMNDVTPRGYRARMDLSDFLRSDDMTRMEVYATGLQVGAITKPEIRAAENRPPLDETADPQPSPQPQEQPANG